MTLKTNDTIIKALDIAINIAARRMKNEANPEIKAIYEKEYLAFQTERQLFTTGQYDLEQKKK